MLLANLIIQNRFKIAYFQPTPPAAQLTNENEKQMEKENIKC